MPATSKHHSSSSPKEIPSSHKHSKSKPIHIPGASTKSKVIIVLPPQMHPPALASSPSHRTAPNPQPVLISSSYPGRRRVGSMGSSSSSSPPGVTFTVSSSSLPKTRPTFQRTGPSPSMSHQRPGHSPQGSNGSPGTSPSNPSHLSTRVTVTGPTLPSGSVPVARAASVDTYTRSTVTRGDMLEDEYYSHPAVRAYEMQKAVEQARWTRHRQMMNAQKQGQMGAQGRW